MQSSNYNAQERAFTSRLLFRPWKDTVHAWGEGSGVVISAKLTWDSHLHLITAKANKLWNNLCNEAFPSGFTSLRCFKSLLMNVFDVDMVNLSWMMMMMKLYWGV